MFRSLGQPRVWCPLLALVSISGENPVESGLRLLCLCTEMSHLVLRRIGMFGKGFFEYPHVSGFSIQSFGGGLFHAEVVELAFYQRSPVQCLFPGVTRYFRKLDPKRRIESWRSSACSAMKSITPSHSWEEIPRIPCSLRNASSR